MLTPMHFTSPKVYLPRSAGVFLQRTYLVLELLGVSERWTITKTCFRYKTLLKVSHNQHHALKYNHWTIVYILKNTRINDLMQDALGDLILEP